MHLITFLEGKPLPWDLIGPCPNSLVCLAQFASFSTFFSAPTKSKTNGAKQYNITQFHASSTHLTNRYNNTSSADLNPKSNKSTYAVLVVLQINNKDVVLGILNCSFVPDTSSSTTHMHSHKRPHALHMSQGYRFFRASPYRFSGKILQNPGFECNLTWSNNTW